MSRASGGGKGRGNGESLKPMDKVRELQGKLGFAAKRSRNRRFALLYDKVYRKDFLWEAWRRVRANGGAPGLDGKTIQAIEEQGVEEFLEGIQKDLKAGEYWPPPVRRQYIPKPDGKQRPLGIPTVRDRVVQAAVKLVIEPIFEADFEACSYGFRPKRSATEALDAIRKAGNAGHDWVVDADIEKYLDRSSYCSPFHESLSKRPGCGSITLMRNPFRFPRRRWIA